MIVYVRKEILSKILYEHTRSRVAKVYVAAVHLALSNMNVTDYCNKWLTVSASFR